MVIIAGGTRRDETITTQIQLVVVVVVKRWCSQDSMGMGLIGILETFGKRRLPPSRQNHLYNKSRGNNSSEQFLVLERAQHTLLKHAAVPLVYRVKTFPSHRFLAGLQFTAVSFGALREFLICLVSFYSSTYLTPGMD